MGLLYDSAIAWEGLRDTTYYLLLGKAGKLCDSITLEFAPEHFPHLAGMQYAGDVDFNLNRAERMGKKFIRKVIAHDIDDTLVEKSENWDSRIKGRLNSILELEKTLDSDFLICKFDPRKMRNGSEIDAKYVIKSSTSNLSFFVFVDENDSSRWYCKSIFSFDCADYTIGQTRVTVLKKQKRIAGEMVSDYTHKNYKPEKEPTPV